MATPIHKFFTKTITLRRLASAGGRKISFQDTDTILGHIQEMDGEARQRLGIIEKRAWYLWCDIDEPAEEGDILVDEDNIEYMVKEITKKDYGINKHARLVIEEANE